MKSLNRLGVHPVSLPLSADDVVEFHAARLLLLLHLCGISGRIDSLTKLAKLDFFVRYPDFFEIARAADMPSDTSDIHKQISSDQAVESVMIRHYYGPWDKRYYHVLAQLEAKHLIAVSKKGNSYQIKLTNIGKDRAKILSKRSSFISLAEHMRAVKKIFGSKNGNYLKKLIYHLFDSEVGKRPIGEKIATDHSPQKNTDSLHDRTRHSLNQGKRTEQLQEIY